ncbi:MEDS domain-containing protein [Halobacteria archaeon HArc-gm2]|nr:MEDS domain-containing protein [Halobacteria archaeon HArc-gm2]
MSLIERVSGEEDDVLTLESGLDALRSSPSFRGPVESLDGHEANEHMALIYEDRAEQVAATVPYLVQGLRRGERCMCLLEAASKDAVLAGLRRTDVDVDAALDTGALTFHTVEETYLRDGQFDPDDMVAFYADVIDEATREYEALRIAATVGWLLEESTSTADFMAYESKVNDLFHGEDCIALCQYDRSRFPPEVLGTVIQTHPHLVYDNTVCHNVYYTPPEEFFGPDQPDREIDRMLRTLTERAEAKVALQERERYLREQNAVVADPDRPFERKVQRLLELGQERLGLDCAALTRWDGDELATVAAVGGHEQFDDGEPSPVEETYCRKVLSREAPLTVEHAARQGWDDDPAYDVWGHESYVGTTVTLGSELYGTVCFASGSPRTEPFTAHERTVVELTSQWIGYELEREHREAQLAALNEMARDLLRMESHEDVAEAAVGHAESTLKLPVSTVLGYDHDEGGLRAIAETDDAADGMPTESLCDPETGPFWETFVANEVRTVDDVGELPGANDDLTEAVAIPLGAHGLFVTATIDRDGFGSAERDFVEATAATLETVTARVERERQLQEREQTLETQNEALERLDRVNDIIRSIDQALVQASTRTEIESVVCERLATGGPYELAWVGDVDRVTGAVRPRESAGAEKGSLDGLTVDADEGEESDHPAARAVERREPQFANDVLSDERCACWRQAALNRGYHAAISLPLVYHDTCYGVLTLYGDSPGVFDELERSVLGELSETIAHAINAVESKKALVSEEAAVLEFAVDDDALPLVTIADEADCSASLDTVVPRPDGRLRGYFTTTGSPADDVLALESRLPVTDLDLVSAQTDDGDQRCHFEATLEAESLAGTVLEHGGRLREGTAADGEATVVVELAADAAVREFVEMFRTRYPGSELLARYSDERDCRTTAEFHGTMTDDLTPRQLEAIQTAYFSGFFERPRPRTGKEIAETMDISQPTFNGHLRSAQRKLCRRLFDADSV